MIMCSPLCRYRAPALLLFLLGCGILRPMPWVGAADPGLGEQTSSQFGITGHYRAGYWTAIRLDPGDSAAAGDVTLETRDGDGVRVIYDQSAAAVQNGWGYVIPGSEAVPLLVRHEDQVVSSSRFPIADTPSKGPSMIPRDMRWLVAFGDPLGIDQIGVNELLDRDALIAVSLPKTADAIPDSILGYDGVDLMIFGGSSLDLLAAMSPAQQSAITQWIRRGGRALVTMGESFPELRETAPWLLELLPLDAANLKTTRINPAALETSTSSQTRLDEFVGVQLPKQVGRALITGRTARRVSTPIAAEYAAGFGRITVIAVDLDDEQFVKWPERLDLLTKILGPVLVPRQRDPALKSQATAYDDLAGQLRATLDQFPVKRGFPFSLVSLILMGLIALVGPLDYLLINRVFGRPLLGWLSFPLIAIGLSILLIQQAQPLAASSESGTVDSSRRCNRVEFIDIDSSRKLGRGHSVSYLYSHDAIRMNVGVRPTETMSAVSSEVADVLTTPFGYPSQSFGGIQIGVEDARLPSYQVTRNADRGSGDLRGLPLAPRSSKSLLTRFEFQPDLPALSVSRRRGSRILRGTLENPLPADLLDGMLVFENWVYLLPTRFPAGSRIPAIEDLRQKNFRWQLSRQKALEENATETEAWDPSPHDSPRRICEMLMFHEAVGGTRYTSLNDDPLATLDLTHALTDDRCMLIGRLSEPMTDLKLAGDGVTAQTPSGETLTMIRLLLPVVTAQR